MLSRYLHWKPEKGDLVSIRTDEGIYTGLVLGPGLLDGTFDVYLQGEDRKEWFMPNRMTLLRRPKKTANETKKG